MDKDTKPLLFGSGQIHAQHNTTSMKLDSTICQQCGNLKFRWFTVQGKTPLDCVICLSIHRGLGEHFAVILCLLATFSLCPMHTWCVYSTCLRTYIHGTSICTRNYFSRVLDKRGSMGAFWGAFGGAFGGVKTVSNSQRNALLLLALKFRKILPTCISMEPKELPIERSPWLRLIVQWLWRTSSICMYSVCVNECERMRLNCNCRILQILHLSMEFICWSTR